MHTVDSTLYALTSAVLYKVTRYDPHNIKLQIVPLIEYMLRLSQKKSYSVSIEKHWSLPESLRSKAVAVLMRPRILPSGYVALLLRKLLKCVYVSRTALNACSNIKSPDRGFAWLVS